MKSFNEKEKKLNDALNKLNALSVQKSNLTSSIEELNNQKNQLEIEKKELENKYLLLNENFKNLNLKFEELKNQWINERKKEEEFVDRITHNFDDVLNPSIQAAILTSPANQHINQAISLIKFYI